MMMRKALMLGVVFVSHAAFAAGVGGAQDWRDQSFGSDGVYAEPGWGRPAPPPPGHYHYHPTLEDAPPAERNVDLLSLTVPRHARRGLVATLALRYRKVAGEAIVRLQMSPGIDLESSNPAPVRGPDGELLWFGLAGPMGSLKVKARINANVPVGTALLIHADLIDGYGKAEQQTETIVVR
jgi:hypothetical protein